MTPITDLAYKYIVLSKYSIDSKTFSMQLETHPDFPSFKSISDTYDYFEIENLVINVPKNIFDQLPTYFITRLEYKSNLELFIVGKRNKEIILIKQNLEKEKISFEKFISIWDGTVMVIDRDPNVEKSNSIHFSLEKTELISLVIITILSLFISKNIQIYLYTMLSLIGLCISYFIVKEAFGIHNKSVAKVCEIISKKNGCSGVINDTKSKLFGTITLSDASIVYFVINISSLVIIGFDYTILFCISLCSIPIVLYTIYYQAFTLKQWCALCLGISTTLFLQFIVLIISFKGLYFNYLILLKYLFIVFIINVVWNNLKSLWIKNIKLIRIETDFLKFKRNKTLFDTLLKRAELVNNNLIIEENKIVYGSATPLLTIYAVTNPLCGFCVESFQTYYKLLKSNKDVQVNFIFSVPFEDFSNTSTKIIVTVLDIYLNQSKDKALKALNDWFEEREISKWGNTYKITEKINDNVISILKNHQDWKHINNIYYTPVTILGNYYFPNEYNINDLHLFIDDILLEDKSF
jgi:uncharacterized membrane protein